MHVFVEMSSYVFAGHMVQAPPLIPEYPELQEQSDKDVEPVPGVVLSSGHTEQASLSVVSVYVPTSHGSHNPLFIKYPAAHRHSSTLTLPSGDSECAGQVVQALLPTTSLYVFAGHSIHVLVISPPPHPQHLS